MPPNIPEERKRLEQKSDEPVFPWHRWGPYVSERAWGTVREDYSANGDAWNYFPFELAHQKAYRWGEDGIAGICDRYQVLIFALAFWNGKDPILKERLYGLSAWQGNHGEDVKECYHYLDATPTHSYMKFLYKYPQKEFPYTQLKEENQRRSARDPEYELIDTGIFDHNAYFDIFVEYAKASPDDLCIKIEVCNRASEPATLHLLPHLWFRNQWAWGDERGTTPKIFQGEGDCLIADEDQMPSPAVLPIQWRLGKRYLYGDPGASFLFTNNETHFFSQEKTDQHYKDAFHRAVIRKEEATNPKREGTKACYHYVFENIPASGSKVLYMRFTERPMQDPLTEVEAIVQRRKGEADAFYKEVHPASATEEEKIIQRQAIAGVLWSKQFYYYDVGLWLRGDNSYYPPPPSRQHIRNQHWRHLNSMRILIMPDKWEYPWFAAWDLAFHCLTLSLVDLDFAKEQLWLLLFDQFQHPNGQLPAYEWEFSDINPPVQAWAALSLYSREKEVRGKGDRDFLERCFHKLIMNFSWWVNKIDAAGNNIFEGGFLGMDNISLYDRSKKLPGGEKLEQSDGTGWMGMYCLNLMRIALELAKTDKVYESLATKFFQHYIYIGHAMEKRGDRRCEMWSEEDGFFYDLLAYPNGEYVKFAVRSFVGIIPLYSMEILKEEDFKDLPDFRKNFEWFLKNRASFVKNCVITRSKGGKSEYVLTLMNEHQLRRVLSHLWNPDEFRSSYGIRSLSKFHAEHPFEFMGNTVRYEPAESLEKIKGGNSNWRGPIWVQMNYLLIASILKLAETFEDEIQLSCAGGEKPVTLKQMAERIRCDLISLFKKDSRGVRPFLGADFRYGTDPLWSDPLLFYEHFNPETGKGLGASHQTGWTALVANLIDLS